MLWILPGPWKRRCLVEYGVVTQCLAPKKLDDQYLTNVLLKINAKVCGAFPFIKTSFIIFCVFVNCQFECILLLSYFSSISLVGWIHFWKLKETKPFLLCRWFRPLSLVWMFHMVHHGRMYHPLLRYVMDFCALFLFSRCSTVWNPLSSYNQSFIDVGPYISVPIRLLVPWVGLGSPDTELPCALNHPGWRWLIPCSSLREKMTVAS